MISVHAIFVITIACICTFMCLVKADSPISPNQRVDCHPEPNATIIKCIKRGCHWSWNPENSGPPNSPACFYPAMTGYKKMSNGTLPILLHKPQGTTKCPYGSDTQTLMLMNEIYPETMLVTLQDPMQTHGPLSDVTSLPTAFQRNAINNATPKQQAQQKDVDLRFELHEGSDRFSYFKIIRQSTNRVLWNTEVGGLLYSEQFVQIASYLPSTYIYGFGENPHVTLKHDLSKYKTWPMFARDEGPTYDTEQRKNLYGVHPFYICVEPDGKAHGVMLYNTHAQEVTLGPAPHLVYRAIGPKLQMVFFQGPTPEQVIRQYHAAIGRPIVPAYWALGFQLCRYGYKNTADIEGAVNRTRALRIPYDTQYADIDYMDHREDFTEGKNFSKLPELINRLHRMSMSNILILDPAVAADYSSFVRGAIANAFITWWSPSQVPDTNSLYNSTKNTDFMLGVVWPDNNTGFPDFFKNQTKAWWADEVKRLHKLLPFDGLWIDMNEPANFGTNQKHPWYFDDPTHANTPPLFCSDDKYDRPPYLTHGIYFYKSDRLSDKTLCMSARHNQRRHYEMHSLYGWSETLATQPALVGASGQRGIVISRSTFPSSGTAGGHWLGDNNSRWPDLRASIIGVIEMNMFGIPYVGADICGFNGETTEELCLRWQQLGAFYPMSRNHNSKGNKDQDPGQWPKTVGVATRVANEHRYMLLPYLYSLHFEAAWAGGTVVRALWIEFGNEPATYDIQEQFMWGDALLFTPVLYEKATSVRGYFPGATWYTLVCDGLSYGQRLPESGWATLNSPTDSMFPVMLRAGKIIPTKPIALTTKEQMPLPYSLLVAINNIGTNGSAFGALHCDDGGSPYDTIYNHDFWSFNFKYNHGVGDASLLSEVARTAKFSPSVLDHIDLFGYPYIPNWESMTVNANAVQLDFTKTSYDPILQLLKLHFASPIYIKNGDTLIAWSHHQ